MANLANGNFIPEIWAKSTLVKFYNTMVAQKICNRNYEGALKKSGDTVHVRKIGSLTAQDYAKNGTISWQDLPDDKVSFVVNQQKIIAFKVDDIDKAQSDIDIIQSYTDESAYTLSKVVDTHVLGLHAGAASTWGTTAIPMACGYGSSEYSPVKVLAHLARLLNDKDVPDAGRWFTGPPVFFEQLMDESGKAIDAAAMGDGTSIVKNGKVGRLLGFDLYQSNNIATDNTYHACMAGTKHAITLAEQLVLTESLRLETTVATGVRQLEVYQAQVMQADALATAYLSFDIEA